MGIGELADEKSLPGPDDDRWRPPSFRSPGGVGTFFVGHRPWARKALFTQEEQKVDFALASLVSLTSSIRRMNFPFARLKAIMGVHRPGRDALNGDKRPSPSL